VSFLPHGRAFQVHKVNKFLNKILPRYFRQQTKWKSFSRQLQLYGFVRVKSGRDAGAYYHELFLKGRPNLCHYMRRVNARSRGRHQQLLQQQQHSPSSPAAAAAAALPAADGDAEDPDFYSMPTPMPTSSSA